MRFTSRIIVGLILAAAVAAGGRAESALLQLQEASYQEETVGDLDAAIEIYEQIISAAEASRPHLAQAYYRLATCHLKKGQQDEAAKTLRKLVEQFPEQKEVVARARKQLARLGQTAAGVVVRQVWAPAVDVLGRVSADRRLLSYVDWETGDLAVRELATGESRRLTNKGPWSESGAMALESAISPDGKKVAYAWAKEDGALELRVVDTAGGEPRVLFDDDEHVWFELVDWFPGGKHILLVLQRNDRTNQIVLISAEDGTVRIVKSFEERYPANARLSPDGRYVAYSMASTESKSADVFLLEMESGKESVLVIHPARDRVLGWAPSGDRLLFSSDRTGSVDAWTIPVAGGKTSGPAQLVRAELGHIGPMTITRDGSLYYSVSIMGFDVYIATIDPQSGEVVEPPKPATSRFAGSNVMPVWSRDGRTLVFSSVHRRGGVGRVLCFLTPETGEQQEFRMKPKLLANFHGLSWSPDDRHVLARNMDATNYRRGLFKIDVQTGDVDVLVYSEPETVYTQPQWSPDAGSVFYGNMQTKRVVRYDIQSGEHREVFPREILEIRSPLALSPDGKEMAIVTADDETNSVVVKRIPVAGGAAREVVRLQRPVRIYSLVWSPDGRRLMYLQAQGQGSKTELWQISANGGEPQRIGLDMPRMRGLSIHPDGRRVAFQAGEQEKYEVWVMENFLPPEEEIGQKQDESQ